jgi:hypothetical protein
MRDTIAEAPLSDSQQKSIAAGPRSAPPFRVSSLWRSPEINPCAIVDPMTQVCADKRAKAQPEELYSPHLQPHVRAHADPMGPR